MRRGIATKVLGGVVLAMAVLLLAIWFSFDRFRLFDARFAEISQHRLPTLFKVSELQAAATGLVSLSADVLYPKGDFLFNNVRTLIEQSQSKARGAVVGLNQSEQVIARFEGVSETLLELVELRGEQLAVRGRIERVFRRLGAIDLELSQAAADPQGQPPWLPHALEAAAHFFVIRDLDHPERIRQHQQGFDGKIAVAQAAIETLPESQRRPAHLTLREFRDYGLGEQGLFELRIKDLQLTQAIERKIYSGKHRMALLDKAIEGLHATTRQAMLAEEQAINAELERLMWLLGGVALAALLALAAIFLYVRRSVVARIHRLHQAMHANMARQPIPIPVEGDDELSQMTRQVNYFIEEINRRESGLKVAAHEAQAANRAKDQFLASISHEIRTPMNAILNLTRIVLEGGLANRQRERLEKVERSSSYLLELINEILDFSRITSGRLELERLPFRLEELLESIETHAEDARAKGLSFHTHVELGTPPVVEGDPLRIQQVLRNLVGNAIKFTNQGGVELLIRVQPGSRQETESIATDGTVWIEFSVEDSGIGIPADKLEQIFAPFNQVDSSTTRRYGGSGLGLSICQRLVDRMGGKLDVVSTPNNGSLFRFALPLPVADQAVALADHLDAGTHYPAQRLAKLKGQRVLLVEDNKFNQAVALELLEHAGLQVELAENGRLAVERMQQASYQLVLMDLHMPEMDGFEASRAIRALPGMDELPIIALTANAMDGVKEQCLAAGMNDLVTKPITPSTLYNAMLRWSKPRPTPQQEVEEQSGDWHDNEANTPPQTQTPQKSKRVRANGRLIQIFLEHYEEFPARLRESLAKDRAQATLMAHNIKSASGTMGASALTQRAAELEALLLQSPDARIPPSMLDALEKEHLALIAELRQQ
jgi:signal transduction histidine kinase/DNA-binding response OmpR family regulator